MARTKISYSNPPVVERILNVQFELLRGMSNGHLGAFWKSLGSDWPLAKDAPAVEPQFEGFSEEDRWRRLGIALSMVELPGMRLQITNAVGDRMIQIQNGRLIFNWLKQEGREYPDYPTVRAGFLDAIARFQRFAAAENLGEIKANQWEITYLNHILHGSVWNDAKDWRFFKPIGDVSGIGGLTSLESLSQKLQYVISENRGRLHISWQHAKRNDDGRQMIVLNLTARGPIPTTDSMERSLIDGIDVGHDAIVASFASYMSEKANAHWGIINAIH